jgi:GWxTD domain-containing protein
MVAIILAGCGKNSNIITEGRLDMVARKDSFFETTRFIMTKEEKNIYRHLIDEEDKKAFIRDFWEKRDPTPSTEENENRIEYNRRIEFANKWFNDRPDGNGWDTERGHLLLQLGIPDHREQHISTVQGTTWQVKTDTWLYYRWRLRLFFADRNGYGQYKLTYWPEELLDALDRARNVLDFGDENVSNGAFNFKTKFIKKKNTIQIKIPVKAIDFEEQGENVSTSFHIRINVYRDYKKIDTLEKENPITRPKEEVLKAKHIGIPIPYTPPGKGKYYLEVIIKDPIKSYRYRDFLQFKVKG